MSDSQHIGHTIAALHAAIMKENEVAAANHAIELLAIVVKDIHRIADAVEQIAKNSHADH